MLRLADRWLTDRVCFADSTNSVDVDAATGRHEVTVTDERTTPALIQEITADRQQNDGRTLGLADRLVSLPATYTVTTGERVTVLACTDPSLVDRVGTVTDVERDSLRARRRVTVRFDSDT